MSVATGVVLVGGRSQRFGAPKVDIRIGGETLLERTRRVLTEALGSAPIVVGGDGLADLRPGRGPLGGLETALSSIEGRVVVVACDMPGVSVPLVRLLAEHPADVDVVVPVAGGRRHPLCARWDRRALQPVVDALDADRRSMHALLDRLTVAEVDEDALHRAGIDPERALWNVNTPGDLQAFQALP